MTCIYIYIYTYIYIYIYVNVNVNVYVYVYEEGAETRFSAADSLPKDRAAAEVHM